jgi:hypothetical protein
VQGDAVDLIEALFQHFAVPYEIRGHVGVAGPAGDELQAAIEHADLPRRIARLAAVLARRHVAHLPRPVHLVAEAPVAHVVRLRVPVRAAQLAPLRSLVEVAVFNVGDRHFRRAGAEIERQQRLGADQAAPFDEFIGAELVRLERIPGALEHRRPLVLRSDAVEPVVAGDEVPARIAHDRDAKRLHLRDDVATESFAVSQGRLRVVDACIDGAAQVLEKCAQQPAVELRPHACLRKDRARRTARGLRISEARQPRSGGERSARFSETREELTAARCGAHGKRRVSLSRRVVNEACN